VWDSLQAFEDRTHSEAFRLAHAQAGQTRNVYLGPPNLEFFEAVI
jgi:heme-degrading monooxygenase HmoA